MSMQVLAINGSPRPTGNTYQALETVAEVLRQHGIEVKHIQLGGQIYAGCHACGGCERQKNRRCVMDTDGMNDILQQVWEADGLLLGSPTYFGNVTTEMKAFIDRCGYVSGANGGLLRHKIGAPVVIMRRAGGAFVYAAINFFFGIAQMPIATSTYWNLGVALSPGDMQTEEEGIRTMENLGENMAWMLRNLCSDVVAQPIRI